jgi:hypothetical protein
VVGSRRDFRIIRWNRHEKPAPENQDQSNASTLSEIVKTPVTLSALCLLASCAAPQQSAGIRNTDGQSHTVATVDSVSAGDDQDYETIIVPPPVGSLLGGGSVRVAKNYSGNDETSLLGNIRRLNAAAGTQKERPFVVRAVSRVTGISERELQAQQDVLRLRFGELCAINAIAGRDSNKVQEIATLRSTGRSWTDLARANGLSIASVTQVARNANEPTVSLYSNNAERARGGQQEMKQLGIRSEPNGQPNN